MDTEPKFAYHIVRFVHNTPLALFTEMGLFGFAIIAAILVLFFRAARGLPVALGTVMLIYLGLPMLLNDALGLRMSSIVLAAGLAGALQLAVHE